MDDIINIKTERTGPVLFSPYTRGEGIKKALSLSRVPKMQRQPMVMSLEVPPLSER